ncbi:hypothetical protein LX32DRAFT_639812 [Colletotrichum zoysiae]|uniref:EPL1 protein n=1 Tax=Colletotrichum zoysiae TaxID=1216348 RepID=A0AAD9HIE8_9PEZI|nr:hypothetical protein LX32DRAFT_639812 [Colletotrichum zoysiae]
MFQACSPKYDDWLLQKNTPPRIVTIPSITGWEHPGCMTCWMVTWEIGQERRFSLAMNGSSDSFVTSLTGMNSLTTGQAKNFNYLEPLEREATRVRLRSCAGMAGSRKETRDEL